MTPLLLSFGIGIMIAWMFRRRLRLAGSRFKKWFVFGGLVLLVGGTVTQYVMDYIVPSEDEINRRYDVKRYKTLMSRPWVEVTATDLIAAYEHHHIAADKKYRDFDPESVQGLSVTGRLAEIKRDVGGIYLMLNGDNPSARLNVSAEIDASQAAWIGGHFLGGAQAARVREARLTQLAKGQVVTVLCQQCDSQSFSYVGLKKCLVR
jgi:hypothetical protein